MRKLAALALVALLGCRSAAVQRDEALLDDVERRGFHYFWGLADPQTLLVAGALFAQSYFDRSDAAEAAIRAAAEELYERVEWTWEQPRAPAISMGWTPEQGFHSWDWRGYNEAMIVIVLALGSPTHPVG